MQYTFWYTLSNLIISLDQILNEGDACLKMAAS